MSYTTFNVTSTGFPINDVLFTYALNASIDVVADLGKAVAIDSSAANTMKLAGTGDRIIGLLITAEDRGLYGKVGTVARQFKEKVPTVPGHGITLGSSVTGNTAHPGYATLAGSANDTVVIEIGTDGTWVAVELL